MSSDFLSRLTVDLPIFQAPMAGVATPEMAAAVSNAGGLGGLGLGAMDATLAEDSIRQTGKATDRPFCANFFCHSSEGRDPTRESDWIARAKPLFDSLNADPPQHLRRIYASFRDEDAMLNVVLRTRPRVVSFHFGLPRPDQMAALKQAGILAMASATSLAEARRIQAAGCDAVIAQGYQAGGHRGIFDPDGPDQRLTTMDLTRQLCAELTLPVVAAGGLMHGADIARALSWGAVAAQLGTAFVACSESLADAEYRERLGRGGTVMTSAISGRPARCLENRLTDWGRDATRIPAYPDAYDLSKRLIAAARAADAPGFGAYWAGTGAAQVRPMPAGKLVQMLAQEWRTA